MPPQSEVEERLAKLKGTDVESIQYPRQFVYQEPDKRNEQEKQSDLIKQIHEEIELDKRVPPPEIEIEQRLEKLRSWEQKEVAEGNKVSDSKENETTGSYEEGKVCGESGNFAGLDTSGVTSGLGSAGGGGDKEKNCSDGVNMEEVDELLKKAQMEAERDAKIAMEGLKKDQQLQAQLRRLTAETRQETLKSDKIQAELGRLSPRMKEENSALEDDENLSDDENAQKLLKTVLAEAELEERLKQAETPPKTEFIDANDNSPVANSKNESFKNSLLKKFWKKEKKTKNKNKAASVGEIQENNNTDKCGGGVEDEELPWCCICTEDAAVRCVGCSGDLYCRKCYREGHDNRIDLKKHKWVQFKKPKKESTV